MYNAFDIGPIYVVCIIIHMMHARYIGVKTEVK